MSKVQLSISQLDALQKRVHALVRRYANGTYSPEKDAVIREAFMALASLLGMSIELPPNTKLMRVTSLRLSDIHADPERFQPRKAAYSEESVERIVNNFDEREFDPLRVWLDPQDGKWYVLAGFSRREARRRIAERDGKNPNSIVIPVDPYEGSESEAIDFARRENNKGTAQTPAENAAYLRSLRASGASSQEVREASKRLYGRNATTVEALSYLNPSGKPLRTLEQFKNDTSDARDALTMASWLGKARARDARLTDAHEKELYNWLLQNYKTKGRKVTNYPSFAAWLANVLEQRTTFGVLDETLNLGSLVSRSPQQVAVEAEVREAEEELRQVKRALDTKRTSLLKRSDDVKAIERALAKEQNAVLYHQRKFLRAKERAAKAGAQLRQQEVSLFDAIRSNPGTKGERQQLVFLGYGDELHMDGEAVDLSGYHLFAQGHTLLLLPERAVTRIRLAPTADATKLYREWHDFEPTEDGFELHVPNQWAKTDPLKTITYWSDKLMQEGDAKDDLHPYRHHFSTNAKAERSALKGRVRDAFRISNIRITSRGIEG